MDTYPNWNSNYSKSNVGWAEPSVFRPKVVGELPSKEHKGRPYKYIMQEAIDLASKNPDKWILAYQILVEDSEERKRKSNTLRTSVNHFNKSNNLGMKAKAMIRENNLELYIIKEVK